MVRSMIVEALGNSQTIDGVGPMKMFRDQPGFIALDRADAMPNQVGTFCRVVQGRDFVDALLDVVFAKIALPHGLRQFLHRLRRKSFGHGQQLHLAWPTARRRFGPMDAIVHFVPSMGPWLVHA